MKNGLLQVHISVGIFRQEVGSAYKDVESLQLISDLK